jgi:hypothetical protein
MIYPFRNHDGDHNHGHGLDRGKLRWIRVSTVEHRSNAHSWLTSPLQALASPTVSTRQAAQTLLLAIQCVLIDAHRTLSLFPRLATGQKDLAMYLMDKNGLILHAAQSQGVDPAEEEERKERVVGEMVGLMARGLPK